MTTLTPSVEAVPFDYCEISTETLQRHLDINDRLFQSYDGIEAPPQNLIDERNAITAELRARKKVKP